MERGPTGDLLIPLPDLESRLAAERCLDIFTMKSRVIASILSSFQLLADLRAASSPSDFPSLIILRKVLENWC